MKKIVTIGGGKGQSTILTGLKAYRDKLQLSAIVSMVDDGGSTGKIYAELQLPPFGGDFKDVLTALSDDEKMVDLFTHRYEHGTDIKGHTVGNLILLGLLEKSDWDIPKAIELAKKILSIDDKVMPSTIDRVKLIAEYEDGSIIEGQDAIDNNLEKKYMTISKIYTEPIGNVYQPAAQAIKEADAIILCPGDLYGSLLCNLVVPGIAEAIRDSRGKIVYITNLMTKINQTHEWTASDFLEEVQHYTPRIIDFAIVNSGQLSQDIAGSEQYAKENWEVVEDNIQADTIGGTKIIKDSIWLEGKEFKRVSTDVIPRSFIRHDPHKIAKIIMGLI